MVNHKVPMAVLYLVAWQDTAKPSTHLNPVVVEVCQAVRSDLKFQFSSLNFSFQPNLNPVVVEVCQALTLRDLIAGPSML